MSVQNIPDSSTENQGGSLAPLLALVIAASLRANDFFTVLWNEVTRQVAERAPNARILLVSNECAFANDYTGEFPMMCNYLHDLREASKVLIVPCGRCPHLIRFAKEQMREGQPWVSITLPLSSFEAAEEGGLAIPSVVTENESGAEALSLLVANQLADLPDIRLVQPVYITGERDRQDSIDRINGFQAGLKNSRLRVVDSLVIEGNWSMEIAEREAEAILKASPEERIVLFMAANDVMALGVRKALVRYQKVYGNFKGWVMGFDAIDQAVSLIDEEDRFLIGTVEQDIPQIVEMALELLTTLEAGTTPKCMERFVAAKRCVLNAGISGTSGSGAMLTHKGLMLRLKHGRNGVVGGELLRPATDDKFGLTKREAVVLEGLFKRFACGYSEFSTDDVLRIIKDKICDGIDVDCCSGLKVSEVFRTSRLMKPEVAIIKRVPQRRGIYFMDAGRDYSRA